MHLLWAPPAACEPSLPLATIPQPKPNILNTLCGILQYRQRDTLVRLPYSSPPISFTSTSRRRLAKRQAWKMLMISSRSSASTWKQRSCAAVAQSLGAVACGCGGRRDSGGVGWLGSCGDAAARIWHAGQQQQRLDPPRRRQRAHQGMGHSAVGSVVALDQRPLLVGRRLQQFPDQACKGWARMQG